MSLFHVAFYQRIIGGIPELGIRSILLKEYVIFYLLLNRMKNFSRCDAESGKFLEKQRKGTLRPKNSA
jgi:hypothetical protein